MRPTEEHNLRATAHRPTLRPVAELGIVSQSQLMRETTLDCSADAAKWGASGGGTVGLKPDSHLFAAFANVRRNTGCGASVHCLRLMPLRPQNWRPTR